MHTVRAMHTRFDARPHPVALVRVAALSPVVAFVRGAGAPLEPLLAKAHLPRFVFDHPEALISLSQVLSFMEESARATAIADVGLVCGREMRIDALGVFGRLIRRARTLREAIETAIETMPAFNSGSRYQLVYDGSRARLRHHRVDGCEPGEAGGRHLSQYCVMLALNVLHLAAEPRWRPGEVVLETAASPAFRDGQVLGGASIIVGRGESSLTFPEPLLSRPLARSCGTRPSDDEDVDAWRTSAPAGDFAGCVLQIIESLSAPEYPRIGMAADAIGMSVRALQRRLAGADVSYARLIARARFVTAMDLLERTDATVLDIALDLGYSDHAHFTRAFRRWTGVPPRDFRRGGHGFLGTSPRLPLGAASRMAAHARRRPLIAGSRR
jgi:AraC-like DNA-binding protein